MTGLRCRCPRCGEGALFAGFLTLADECDNCGLSYDFADSGDGPAILVMFPVGTIVVLGWLICDMLFHWPAIVHLLVWLPATLLLSLAFLPPFKGVLVNTQYKAGARPDHGFKDSDPE